MSDCPCGSGLPYPSCCGKYHSGALPDKAEALMRSRYSAYAKGLVEYIIETTDPSGPHFTEDLAAWRASILDFCRSTTFEKLEVIDQNQGLERATVSFVATLRQGGELSYLTEKSVFFRRQGRWLYHSAKQ